MTPTVVRRAHEATVLWVDDNPANNRMERDAFALMGFRFTLSQSTEDALARLGERRFDAIITDMGRSGDGSAGYTLLDAVRQQGDQTPFFIYAGSNRHKDEAMRRGAQGSTNRADELLQMVASTLAVRN